MKVTLLGIEKISYTKKGTNDPVSAVNLHVSYRDNRVDGERVQSVFVSDRLGFRTLIDSTFKPGMLLDLDYAPNGSINYMSVSENPFEGKK